MTISILFASSICFATDVGTGNQTAKNSTSRSASDFSSEVKCADYLVKFGTPMGGDIQKLIKDGQVFEFSRAKRFGAVGSYIMDVNGVRFVDLSKETPVNVNKATGERQFIVDVQDSRSGKRARINLNELPNKGTGFADFLTEEHEDSFKASVKVHPFKETAGETANDRYAQNAISAILYENLRRLDNPGKKEKSQPLTDALCACEKVSGLKSVVAELRTNPTIANAITGACR